MKLHTTNYINTFIEVADDSPALQGEIPPRKDGTLSIATRQFDLIRENPYQFTSDDVLFAIHAQKNDLADSEHPEARQQFFSKGQACFRSSPLTKRYGWGVHSNEAGKIALYAIDSAEYTRLANDATLKHVKAMRSKRA
ncbi:DUF6157 family protein [Spirosoma sp. KUDC1026]|uniref:DUF6157 family protein n=1 Tax=Spirosoma sp. KUDC1026 TaxID=2745947 RepID=UPI00159BE7A8|nr:DUF6157 family protein [Spirosoma sp. KUDC1026]QKZ14325.1 hypothetical protein HU175_17495 [Spirosoma sp. KUDC1026]